MSDYRIVCTEKTTTSSGHSHIAVVGTGTDPGAANKRWTVDGVRAAILQEDQFHTVGATSGRRAYVERFDCACGAKTIRTIPDQVTDNNLDSLRACAWKS